MHHTDRPARTERWTITPEAGDRTLASPLAVPELRDFSEVLPAATFKSDL